MPKKLPTESAAMQESRKMQDILEANIRLNIRLLEKEYGYKFDSYEIDLVMLKMITSNHQYYVRESKKEK